MDNLKLSLREAGTVWWSIPSGQRRAIFAGFAASKPGVPLLRSGGSEDMVWQRDAIAWAFETAAASPVLSPEAG